MRVSFIKSIFFCSILSLFLLSMGCAEQKSPQTADQEKMQNEGSFFSESRKSLSPEEMLAAMDPDEQNLTVMNALVFGLTAFRCHSGRFPTEEEGLAILTVDSSENPLTQQGPYAEPRFLNDPWGNPYEYEVLSATDEFLYNIISYGPDGVPSQDDVSFISSLPESRQFASRTYMKRFVAEYERKAAEASSPDLPDQE
jgi:hypothetical protein